VTDHDTRHITVSRETASRPYRIRSDDYVNEALHHLRIAVETDYSWDRHSQLQALRAIAILEGRA
jgi:hypothetical protein